MVTWPCPLSFPTSKEQESIGYKVLCTCLNMSAWVIYSLDDTKFTTGGGHYEDAAKFWNAKITKLLAFQHGAPMHIACSILYLFHILCMSSPSMIIGSLQIIRRPHRSRCNLSKKQYIYRAIGDTSPSCIIDDDLLHPRGYKDGCIIYGLLTHCLNHGPCGTWSLCYARWHFSFFCRCHGTWAIHQEATA